MPGVEWESLVPAHEQIATALRERIVNGVYEANSRLPHRDLLAEEFGVSHATVSKATALLRAERRLVYAPGRGLLIRTVGQERSEGLTL